MFKICLDFTEVRLDFTDVRLDFTEVRFDFAEVRLDFTEVLHGYEVLKGDRMIIKYVDLVQLRLRSKKFELSNHAKAVAVTNHC